MGEVPAYGRGGAGLVAAVQALSLARDVETIQDVVRHAARELTGADGATFVLRDDGRCYYVDEDAIAPLWKGQRFPLETCISGWTMLNRRAARIPDIYADDRIPHAAYRPTFVKSLVMVPIRQLDPVGAIGNYWARYHEASDEDVDLLQALANSTAVAMENVAVHSTLEATVADRTSALQEAVETLGAEVERRRQAERQVRLLSVTDELTAVGNRRGFLRLAAQELHALYQSRQRGLLLFIDVDHLKALNDAFGHDAGDRCLNLVAGALTRSFRAADVVARLGGDEFVVLVTHTDAAPRELARRIRLELTTGGRCADGAVPEVSIGVVTVDGTGPETDLAELLADADEAMYEDKRARRARRGALDLRGVSGLTRQSS